LDMYFPFMYFLDFFFKSTYLKKSVGFMIVANNLIMFRFTFKLRETI